MKFATRSIIVTIFLGLFCMMLWGCSGCGKHRQTIQIAPTASDRTKLDGEPGDTIIKFQHYMINVPLEGPQIWTAEVQSGQWNKTTGKLILTGVKCHLYDYGKEVLLVMADSATAVIDGKNVRAELTGHIKAVDMRQQQHLDAETFRWSSTDKIIHATNFNFTSPKVNVRAPQGTFNSDLTQMSFNGRGTIEIAGNAGRKP